MKSLLAVTLVLCCLLASLVQAEEQDVRVELDTSEVPHLEQWGEEARALALRWYPRVDNLLATKDFQAPRSVKLTIRKSEEGVAATSGSSIVVSSHWIEKQPEDFGLVVHELVHVLQAYPTGQPGWVTEGISDYIRWAIYEGKPQSWFPRPQKAQGYKDAYHVAAGFFLWLEADRAPGIVRKLNTAMRRGAYSEELFASETGLSLDALWDAYAAGQG
jgi:hypothetical protein